MKTHVVNPKVIWHIIFVMNTQEFILRPKVLYTQQNNRTLHVLKDPEVEQKQNFGLYSKEMKCSLKSNQWRKKS